MERERRNQAIRAGRDRQHHAKSRAGWAGSPAAIYCRISRANDDDQTGVDRQERLCREVADRLGLVINDDAVFVDPNRSAWQRNRKRPGWDKLMAAMRAERFRHVIVYHPDRLMRQPKDLEELLTISDDQDITLHGQANQRDLSDPDDRFFLRIEVAHACRSSDDTSRRLRDKLADKARDGLPHQPGKRRYGYTQDGMTIIEDEAEIIREIYDRYLDGQSPREIAHVLLARGVPTPLGKEFQPSSVRRILESAYVTGLLRYHDEIIGEGVWPAIIDRGRWQEVQDRRTMRASAFNYRPHRYYLLRGLVTCKRCGTIMSGSSNKQPSYACNRQSSLGELRCTRRIFAPNLEKFVTDAAVELLTRLDLSGMPTATVTVSDADRRAIEADQAELAELKDMWDSRELSTREYREMRRTVEERIAKRQQKPRVRPTAKVLEGLVGPHARQRWDELAANEEYERMNAVLRFLFAAVIIDEHRGPPGKPDYSRIEIEPNPL